MNRCIPVFVAVFGFAATAVVHASNVGGVFGPVVKEGHESLQYRAAVDGQSDNFAHRMHYQSALNDDLMWRVLAQESAPEVSERAFDLLGAELFWQLPDLGEGWQTGLRWDLRLRDRDRPHSVGLNWTNQFALAGDWRLLAVLLTSADVGRNRRSGVGLQTRFQAMHSTSPLLDVGLELYSSYGRSNDLQSSTEQSHQLGPVVSWKFSRGWALFAGPLFGLTNATDDTTYRFWITRAFQ